MNDVERFRERRFGMFVHWGAYSVAARGEWKAELEKDQKAA